MFSSAFECSHKVLYFVPESCSFCPRSEFNKEIPVSKKNKIAKDLRTPKYKPRIIQSKKRKLKDKALRRELKDQLPSFLLGKGEMAGTLLFV